MLFSKRNNPQNRDNRDSRRDDRPARPERRHAPPIENTVLKDFHPSEYWLKVEDNQFEFGKPVKYILSAFGSPTCCMAEIVGVARFDEAKNFVEFELRDAALPGDRPQVQMIRSTHLAPNERWAGFSLYWGPCVSFYTQPRTLEGHGWPIVRKDGDPRIPLINAGALGFQPTVVVPRDRSERYVRNLLDGFRELGVPFAEGSNIEDLVRRRLPVDVFESMRRDLREDWQSMMVHTNPSKAEVGTAMLTRQALRWGGHTVEMGVEEVPSDRGGRPRRVVRFGRTAPWESQDETAKSLPDATPGDFGVAQQPVASVSTPPPRPVVAPPLPAAVAEVRFWACHAGLNNGTPTLYNRSAAMSIAQCEFDDTGKYEILFAPEGSTSADAWKTAPMHGIVEATPPPAVQPTPPPAPVAVQPPAPTMTIEEMLAAGSEGINAARAAFGSAEEDAILAIAEGGDVETVRARVADSVVAQNWSDVAIHLAAIELMTAPPTEMKPAASDTVEAAGTAPEKKPATKPKAPTKPKTAKPAKPGTPAKKTKKVKATAETPAAAAPQAEPAATEAGPDVHREALPPHAMSALAGLKP